jgi:hypothetical protein
MPAPFTEGIVREGYGHECYGRKDTMRMVLRREVIRVTREGNHIPRTEFVLFDLEMPDGPERGMGLRGWDRPGLKKELATVATFEDGVMWVDGVREIGVVATSFRRDAR